MLELGILSSGESWYPSECVLEGMIDGVRLFHEQDLEAKKQLYSLDPMKKVRVFSNYDMYQTKAANWMDTLLLTLLPSNQVSADELTKLCRAGVAQYMKMEWRVVAIFNLILFVVLSIIYFVGCCARRNASRNRTKVSELHFPKNSRGKVNFTLAPYQLLTIPVTASTRFLVSL